MTTTGEAVASFVRERLPQEGLFQDQHWRIAIEPFALSPSQAKELESLGRVLLQFYKAINLLHRQSAAGKQPAWVCALLDQGKPETLLEWQRHPTFKNELPRVIRPDLLLTDDGFAITELDSVPGGIGLTAWLHRVYSEVGKQAVGGQSSHTLVGGADGIVQGFNSIFGPAPRVHLVVSKESAAYRPEMAWLAAQLDRERFAVRDTEFSDWAEGDAVYRFFELFDLSNIASFASMIRKAADKQMTLTPPIKPCLEEKLNLALLWNRNLRAYWRQELGDGFLQRLLKYVPYSWVIDPSPIPPHAAIPGLELTDWQQLKELSQRERELILKVSGYSEEAWGARGVYLGSDLSQPDWAAAVEKAITGFSRSPFILQRYHKAKVVNFGYYDFAARQSVMMAARVRLCPYYFVVGQGDAARAVLGGVLATACPADKKIIHGMRDAILAPCRLG